MELERGEEWPQSGFYKEKTHKFSDNKVLWLEEGPRKQVKD